MKYSKFERDVEAMGYSTVKGKDDLYVRKGGLFFISVGLRSTYIVNSNFDHFVNLEDSEKERLLSLAWQLASTPLEAREDEELYRLRIPFMGDQGYLNVEKATGSYYLTNKTENDRFRTVFTRPEISELEEKHDLDSFTSERASGTE